MTAADTIPPLLPFFWLEFDPGRRVTADPAVVPSRPVPADARSVVSTVPIPMVSSVWNVEFERFDGVVDVDEFDARLSEAAAAAAIRVAASLRLLAIISHANFAYIYSHLVLIGTVCIQISL